MKTSAPLLALLFTAGVAVSGIASAQSTTAAAASGPKTRTEVKNEVKDARAKGEMPPDGSRYQVGDPPVAKKMPAKAKSSKKAASSAM